MYNKLLEYILLTKTAALTTSITNITSNVKKPGGFTPYKPATANLTKGNNISNGIKNTYKPNNVATSASNGNSLNFSLDTKSNYKSNYKAKVPNSTSNVLNGTRPMLQPTITSNNSVALTKAAAEYLPINDYPGYFVSREGVIYSNKYGDMTPLKPRPARNGYQRVYMRNSNTNKRDDRYIHRLVAQAYLENPDNVAIVNHKDCNRENNNVDNLEWTTSAGNNLYTLEHNRAIRDALGRFQSV